jgi:hypothetical protein
MKVIAAASVANTGMIGTVRAFEANLPGEF